MEKRDMEGAIFADLFRGAFGVWRELLSGMFMEGLSYTLARVKLARVGMWSIVI